MIKSVDHVEVTVQDMDRTINFYTKVLGFKLARRVKYETPGYAGELACITLGGFMLELLGPTQPKAGQGDPADPGRIGLKMVALTVDDMAQTLKDLAQHGVEVTWGPRDAAAFDGLRAEIKDPDGISIELREWKRGDSPFKADWQPTKPGIRRVS